MAVFGDDGGISQKYSQNHEISEIVGCGVGLIAKG